MIRVALAQVNPTVGDLVGNQRRVSEYIKKARNLEADIVVFPELVICGYPPEDLLYKNHFVGDNIKALRSLAKETRLITAIVGFVDCDSKGRLYNAAAVIHDGQIKGVFQKHELPNYGVFDEKRYFNPGTSSPIFSLKGGLFAVNICEDIWVDDAVYKEQAQKGARLLINISSSPYHEIKQEDREMLLKKRAKETKSFVCYTNLIGGQDELVFDGTSMIVSPQGKIIARANEFEEDLLTFDIEIPLQKKNYKKAIFLNSKSGSKIPLKTSTNVKLSRNEKIYKALVLGTRDYVRKNNFEKVVLGLSGGIDSSVVAAIACKAIGSANVIGVSMPSRFTSSGTREDAKFLAKKLNIKFLEIPIERVYAAYLDELSEAFNKISQNSTEENIQARIRGNYLMALSNKFGWLVLTTGNKSEIAVGYCTLYGDMSGGFAVIKDVPKTKIYELAELINKDNLVIPQSVIDRAPTAELRENQKDQDTLPEYSVLDKILEEYVEGHKSFEQIAKKIDADTVKKVIRMIDSNEYKRRQAAPGIKITSRAFGKDWRLPITNKYREF